MVNSYRKGNRTQQKCKRYYESLGFEVEVTRRDKWRKDQDFFGLWDLICVSKTSIIFVQVKTNHKPSAEWIERAKKWKCPKGSAAKVYAVYKDYQRGDAPEILKVCE